MEKINIQYEDWGDFIQMRKNYWRKIVRYIKAMAKALDRPGITESVIHNKERR